MPEQWTLPRSECRVLASGTLRVLLDHATLLRLRADTAGRAWHRGVNTRGGWKARFLCASYSAADAARISVEGRREPERRRSVGGLPGL